MRPPSSIRLALALTAAMLLMPARPSRAAEPAKLSVGDIAATATDWPDFVAMEKGFYKDEGVAPEVTHVGNAASVVQQLVGGSFVIAFSTVDTTVRAIGSGADIVMIGSTILRYPYSVMTQPQVASVKDLEGKSIMLPFAKDFLTVFWNRWSAERGAPAGKIEQLYDGSTPDRFAALSSGTIGATVLGQPYDFRAAAQGYRKLVDLGAYAKDYGFLAVLAKPSWLTAHATETRAYLRALGHATDWIYDPANRAEATAILARGTKLDPAAAADTYTYYVEELQPFSRKLVIPERTITTTVDTLVSMGDIRKPTRPITDLGYYRSDIGKT